MNFIHLKEVDLRESTVFAENNVTPSLHLQNHRRS